MRSLMIGLMAWASSYTGIPAASDVPEVQFLDRCGLYREVHTDTACPPEGEGAMVPAGVHRRGTIYLKETWSPASLTDVSTLLHELVHHMQAESGIPLTVKEGEPCPSYAIERPAYEAQVAWLRAAGVADVHGAIRLSEESMSSLTEECPERVAAHQP